VLPPRTRLGLVLAVLLLVRLSARLLMVNSCPIGSTRASRERCACVGRLQPLIFSVFRRSSVYFHRVDEAACVCQRVPWERWPSASLRLTSFHRSFVRIVGVAGQPVLPAAYVRWAFATSRVFLRCLTTWDNPLERHFQLDAEIVTPSLRSLLLGISADRGTPANFHPAFRRTTRAFVINPLTAPSSCRNLMTDSNPA